MIYAGSALMVYNIIRYGGFVKTRGGLERNSRSIGLLIVPLLLLIFFLIGYIAVGVSGIADLMVAAILLGGSIFVFLLLAVMFSIIAHIRETDKVLSLRYEEMKEDLSARTKDSLAVFLVNLTRDEVEERAGSNLYESDYASATYSEMIRARGAQVIDPSYAGADLSILRREELLRRYQEGQTYASETLLIRLRSGEAAFVNVEVTLSKMPVSGDVIALLTERPYNEQVVRDTLLETVLMDQFDRIAYLVDGSYHVLISNAGRKEGLLFPDDSGDTYEYLYLNFILPTMSKNREKTDGPNPLRLSVIDKALAEEAVYEVNAPFDIDGVTRYKRILFYRIDRNAKFYLMLISDSTSVQEEQMAQNRRLSDALADAMRSNQARIRFFTNVSHDLRTPMNGILGFTQLARNESDPEKLRDYLGKVDFSGRRLLSLMDDLFTMSTIESGTIQLNEEPTDLRAMAEELREQFASEKGEKNLTFTADTEKLSAPVALCDGQRLRRLLARLLENACTFAPKDGYVRISVNQTGAAGPEREGYEFRIRNNGLPIPPDKTDQVFEADAWTTSAFNEKLPGVGLGMAVAKAFVDLMGGTAFARTREDGDTEFVIRMAFPPVVAEPETPEAQAAEGMALHILLVDDNEISREIGELMLTAEGWTVEQAENGAEAVEKVRAAGAGHFDVVLMDVQMPVMNGYEATAAIRALPDASLAAIPIIAVTANAYQEDANEALAAGMDGYTTKPIDPAAIRSVVGKVLNAPQKGAPQKGGEQDV